MYEKTRIGNNTSIFTDEGTCKVILHNTKIVEFSNGNIAGLPIVLNSGGWTTVTTKRRMNQISEMFGLGFSVYQKDFEWFVVWKDETLSFYDGMSLA